MDLCACVCLQTVLKLINPSIYKKGSKSFNFFSQYFLWLDRNLPPHFLGHTSFTSLTICVKQAGQIHSSQEERTARLKRSDQKAIPTQRQLHLWAEGELWREYSAAFQTGQLQRKANTAGWAACLTARAPVKCMSS